MAPLTWRHHVLIQALMSRGPLEEKEFHSIFTGISSKNPVTHNKVFNDVLLKINKELAYVQFELRGCRNQYDGKVYYGVVNNVTDEQSKLGTKYSIPQIVFYKAIIDAVMQDATAQGCISNVDALNIRLENQIQTAQGSQDGQSQVPSVLKNFSLSQKEKTLNDLVRDRWLCSTSNGNIGLGVRSFLDLRSWFRNNDVPSCEVCNEAGVKAETCQNDNCNVRIHDYCLKKKFSQRKVARVCPGCGTAWPFSETEGEDEEANNQTQGQASSSSLARRKKLLGSCKAEAVEAAQDQSQVAPDGPAPRRGLRSCKAEAAGTDEVGSSRDHPAPHPKRRTRSSRHV